MCYLSTPGHPLYMFFSLQKNSVVKSETLQRLWHWAGFFFLHKLLNEEIGLCQPDATKKKKGAKILLRKIIERIKYGILIYGPLLDQLLIPFDAHHLKQKRKWLNWEIK